MNAKATAVRAFLEAQVPKDGQRSAVLVDMTADMVARALRGELHWDRCALETQLKKAIVGATGRMVERVFADETLHLFRRRPYTVDYSESLATRVRERHWNRLRAGFERAHGDKWEKAKDAVWDAIFADARPYGLTAWSNPGDPPKNSPGENLLTTLFYFVSFATLGDGEAMEQLGNLVRLLPHAVPIGEWRNHAGHWLFVIHQVR